MKTRRDISGQRFGRLVAIHFVGRKHYKNSVAQIWRVRCDCGQEKDVATSSLISGYTRSCGCMPKRARKHGHARAGAHSAEYRTWAAMLARCRRPTKRSACYSEIEVCERWATFQNFLEDMGPKPSPSHSIDRIDPTRGYEPDNCRWATVREQAQNRRNTVRVGNVALSALAHEHGLKYRTIADRFHRGDRGVRLVRPPEGRAIKCKKGHLLTPENTYTHGGSRRCRTCNLEYMRARNKLRRSQAATVVPR